MALADGDAKMLDPARSNLTKDRATFLLRFRSKELAVLTIESEPIRNIRDRLEGSSICGLAGRKWISLLEAALMPVRINGKHRTRCIELRHLRSTQIPTQRAQVLAKLFFISRPNHHG